MASKMYYGSINVTELNAAARAGHSAFVKAGEKNNIFVNCQIWLNEEPDKYGNNISLKVNPLKDSTDKGFYIGNFKFSTEMGGKPLTAADADSIPTDDDLPF